VFVSALISIKYANRLKPFTHSWELVDFRDRISSAPHFDYPERLY